MKLHKAGYSLLTKIFFIFLTINVLIFTLIPGKLTGYIFLAIFAVLFLLCLNFFRFPSRKIRIDDNSILAPADGKVVVIEETFEPEYLKRECLQVSIFMNVFNVHINWFPINGIVKFFKHHSGKYMAAYLPKSSTENERTTIVIQHKAGEEILMRQIAGAVAKRIVSYAEVGKSVRQDEHAGFIKFGSRVDLFLPLNTEIKVELGEKTTGSQTVIGTLKITGEQ